jgi:formylglycine-generating enzyme required for sulfatase activity
MYRISFMLGLAATRFTFVYTATRPWNVPQSPRPGTVWIPRGEFTIGPDSDLGWSDQKPGRRVRVDGSRMDDSDLTRAQLTRSVLGSHGSAGYMQPERHAVSSSPCSA